MAYYIINRNADEQGDNEIHNVSTCTRLPEEKNQVVLGDFNNAIEAKKFARSNGWPHADGCFYCCSEAHKK